MREQKLKDKLEEINKELITNGELDTTDVGVLSGSSGLALYHFYYNAYNPNETSEDVGSEIIASIVGSINEGYNFHTFCGGIAGAAWTIELLNELEFIEVDTDSLLGVLDDYLNHVANSNDRDNFYDFLHGLIGVGYYFLKRYENTSSEELKAKYEKMLLEMIAKLDSTAQKSEYGIYWESILIREEGLKGCNESSRLAWCYGDLGVAVSLWQAAKVMQNEDVKQTAIQLLEHAATRRDIKETRIVDGGLCHGAFGVMHIFDFMYKETSNQVFKDAADYWIDYGLTIDHHKDGSAGYKKWRGGDTPTYEKENSLLEGIAGIGLAILSYLNPEKTDWNQCLMIG